MDPTRFDHLTRLLSASPSRRRLLGGALGVLAAVLGAPEGEAKRKPARRPKRKRRESHSEVVQNGCAQLCQLIFPKDKRGQQQCLAFAASHPEICNCLSFCRRVYRTNLSQQLACLKAATKGSGICLQCGADPERFCHGTCCTAPQTCGGGGTPGICGSPACTPTTCVAQGKTCGPIPDGCGGTISCGTCPVNMVCQDGQCATCATEGSPCAGDGVCCGGVCCRDELIDPVGTCCASRNRCCGRDCCTEGEACDQRFLMCVPCTKEGECQNPVPFCVCCPGLDLLCDGEGCRCVPKPVACPAGNCTATSCGTGCTCVSLGGGAKACVALGSCPVGNCTAGTCGTGCTCVSLGTLSSRCVSTSTCPAGTCTAGGCGGSCVCLGTGLASRCIATVG